MILVTGPTGLIGQQVVARLAGEDELVCLVRPAHRLRQFAPGVSVRVVSGDVDDLPTLRLAMHGVHSIIHLASISAPNRRHTLEAVNVGGTRNLIEAAIEVGVRRLIFVSPIGADPHSAYAYLKTKGQAEEAIQSSGLDYTILSSSAVYGEGDEWTTVMAAGMRLVPFIFPIPGDGLCRLQPMYVDDLVECVARCLADDRTSGRTMAVGGPQHMSLNDVVAEIMKVVGLRRRAYHMRAPTARTLARLSARLFRRPLFSDTDIDLLSINRTTELNAVSYQFGFQPARFADSIGYLSERRPWRRMFIRYLMSHN
jgi:NADH dehydrogenase